MLFIYMNYICGNELPLMVCLNLSSILFIMGLVGIVWNKRSILIMLLCIEMMFFAMSLNFMFVSMCTFNSMGQMFCLFIMTAVAAETAMGLSLLIILFSLSNKINYNSLITLRH